MRTRWSAVAVVLAAIAAHMGCVEGLEFIATGASSGSSSTGSGGQGGTGTASTSSSAGGSGATGSATGGSGGGCMSPSDCPGIETLCRHKTCGAGICDFYLEPSNTVVDMTAEGDCKNRVCNSSGAILLATDGNDAYVDGNECTTDTCNGMMPENNTVPEKLACNGGIGYCCSTVFCNLTPQGMACKECHPDVPGSCTSGATPVCQKGKCVANQCANAMKDASEGGIDCGGPCALCIDGAACTVSADCESQVCSGSPKTCVAPTCMDNKKNGTETGVDCGGSCPSKCTDGFACVFPSDCESSVCLMNKCEMPTCMDGVKNGAETDIDCGGSCSACP